MASDIFVVVTRAGYAKELRDRTYWQVLADLYRELQSAGGNHDMPNMLIHNGKVVVDKNLHSIAYAYGRALTEANLKAVADAQARFMPEWL